MVRLSLLLTLVIVSAFSCSKDGDEVVTGTLVATGGCLQNSWLVRIDNPNPDEMDFLCSDGLSFTGDHCGNAVFISIPGPLAVANKRIKFSGATIQPSCLSSSMAPNHIVVNSISEY